MKQAAKHFFENKYILHTKGYNWIDALRHVGYSESYAKARTAETWTRAETYLKELMEKHETKVKWDLDWIDEEFKSLYEECRTSSDKTNAKGCLDSMARRKAGFTDRIAATNEEITSLTPEQEAINDEAVRLAKIKLSETPQDAPGSLKTGTDG